MEKLTQRHNRREQARRFDLTRMVVGEAFLQIQKSHLSDPQNSPERFCKVIPVFGFNSANFDQNLVKSHSLPILVNEQDIELTVMKIEPVHFVEVRSCSAI